MNSVIAIATLVFALSLCNLTGKRSNQNSNTNRPSGTSEETNQNSSDQEKTAPPPIGSGLPPSQTRNSNATMPGSSKTGPASTLPGVNQNSAANIPRAPISGGVMNGKAISLPKPAYPAIAKAAHASGTVNVRVTVDENGNVISASAVSGHPLLQQSAVQAARQAKFSPTKLSGQPVKVTGIIVYNFVPQ